MALVLNDRVKDSTTTSGTGAITLSGTAPTGYRTFSSQYSTGSSNTFHYCIQDSTTGDWEVGNGYLSAATTLVRSKIYASSNSNNAVNFAAGNTKDVFVTMSANMANGYGYSNISSCTILGNGAGANISGSSTNCTYIGASAGGSNANLSAVANTFVGSSAGGLITSANNSAFFGYSAGARITTAANNTAIGPYSMYYNTTGGNNTYVGTSSGWFNLGANNTALGFQALYGVSGQSGGNNTAIGYQALYAITSGTNNVAVGNTAGNAITTGTYNTAIGNNAQVSATLTYATAIGAGSSATTSNSVVLGRNTDTVTVTGSLNLSTVSNMSGTVTSTSSTVQTTVCTLSATVYRSVTFNIQVNSGTNYTSAQIIANHDGTNAVMVQVGDVVIGSALGVFDVSISAGNIVLLFTPASATSTTIKVIANAITI